MKIQRLILLAFFFVLTLGSCEKLTCEKGEGPLVTQALQVPNFDAFDVSINANVNLSYGEAQSVTVTGQQNIIDNLSLDVRDANWNIKFDGCYRRYEDLVFDITLPQLTEVKISGCGTVTSTDTFPSPNDFKARISGAGNMDLNVDAQMVEASVSGSGDIALGGLAEQIEQRISGSGNISSYPMTTARADVRISGSGNCRTNANDALTARITGSGSIYYRGTPEVDANITGSGEVINDN